MSKRLQNKKVLVTQCDDYMGPAICKLFQAEGAAVSAVPGFVPGDQSVAEYAADLDDIDILIANLAFDPTSSPITDITDEGWQRLFDVMVHPLMSLVRHFGPKMVERGHGKIVAITSAAPLRGIAGSSAYCAARGAQNAFIKASGIEYAKHNVQINAVAQNYVSNPAYFPDDLVASERFQKHLQRNVPIGRVARPEESAELALFLASDKSDFMVGQVVPFSGGWAINS
ncbi:MAG: 2-keto-3-deoxy-L-fuconate dehydrogenase [Patiriisocius sp.]|jgi:2-keto-3-deoxy-L-fuconate dehydrogenase